VTARRPPGAPSGGTIRRTVTLRAADPSDATADADPIPPHRAPRRTRASLPAKPAGAAPTATPGFAGRAADPPPSPSGLAGPADPRCARSAAA
jgi:hypothetical protein